MKKNTYLCILAIFICSINFSFADVPWQALLKKYKIPDVKKHSYCYLDKNQTIVGENINETIRLASVSKIITSLWVLDSIGPSYTFDTIFYTDGDNIHIEGSFDPFFHEEKAFFLVSELSRLNFSKIKTVSFNDRLFFDFLPGATSVAKLNPNQKITAANLAKYLNPKSWNKKLKMRYENFYSKMKDDFPKLRTLLEINISAEKIIFSNKNLLADRKIKPIIYRLSSAPVIDYLKFMNVHSHNALADFFFEQLGGEKKLSAYIKGKFNFSDKDIHLFTGSGLDSVRNGIRVDNYATCSIVLEIVKALQYSFYINKISVNDLLLVTGVDGGTLKKRLTQFPGACAAKTGTLCHTSALAGILNTKDGQTPFAIFTQSKKVAAAKKMEVEAVCSIYEDCHGPIQTKYLKEDFISFTGELL